MLEVYIQFPLLNHTMKLENFSINGANSNLINIGLILYSWEVIIYGSLVLLVALIGAIVLTLSHSEGVKRQELYSKWTQ